MKMNEDEREQLILKVVGCINKPLADNLGNKLTQELATGIYTVIDSNITAIMKSALQIEEPSDA